MNLTLPLHIIHLILALNVASCCGPKGNGEKVCQLDEMTPETFVTKDTKEENEKEFNIKLSKEPIGEGTFGKVYHAHPDEDLVDFDGKLLEKQCVALKELNKEHDSNLDNEVRILKEFAKLEDKHRRHLVKLYQAGKIKSSGNQAYIMELGEQSLDDYFENNAAKLTEEQIWKIAKDIGLAMQDFHRVAMHLDLKPENMMYFPEPNGEMILKAIDFGSCQLLSIKVADQKFASYGPEHRANFCRKISDLVGTVRYNSPEIRYTKNMCEEEDSWEKSAKLSSNTHIVLTPKSDIWSIGIMIYEAILSSSQTDLEFFYALRGKITMETIIYELNYMYKYDETKWIAKRADAIKKKKQNIFNTKENQDEAEIDYAAYVYLVLKVHLNYPFLYKLINSCLEFEPKNRPSAIGLLDYLDGECQLQPIKADSTPILLTPATIGIIGQTLVDKKHKIKVNIMPQLKARLANPLNTEKDVQLIEKLIEKRKRQLQEIKNIEDLYQHYMNSSNFGPNANFDLRSIILGGGSETTGRHGQQQAQQPLRWCDTTKSELPKYKKEGEDTQDLSAINSRNKIGTAPEQQQKMSRSISASTAQFKQKVDIYGLREY